VIEGRCHRPWLAYERDAHLHSTVSEPSAPASFAQAERHGNSPLAMSTGMSPRHSLLSALIGSIDAARPAGRIAATNAQVVSAAAAAPSAIGSQKVTS
jgi:hypothetical protein